jgi:uncharacterized protein
MKQLTDLSKDYRDFYAPNFMVRVGKQDVLRQLKAAVTQVEVDLVLGKAARFSFTIADCYSPEFRVFKTAQVDDLLKILELGSEVEISMGYRDAQSTPLAVCGTISEITTNFPEGGSPELSIAGFDHGHALTMGKRSYTWKDARDSDAVQKIASFNNLNAKVEPTKLTHKIIEQNQEDDWGFLKKLAERQPEKFEVYIDELKTLHFAPPSRKSEPVVQLDYGRGLLSFKPEANLASQISKVEVYGWDTKTKKPIIGVANAGEESGLNGRSGSQVLKSFVRDPAKQPVFRMRQPVFSKAEADQRAKAALNERAKQFVTGDGESIGIPEVRPDRNILLTNLGKPFSKIYYVQQATHKIDSNGYRTRFKVEERGL